MHEFEVLQFIWEVFFSWVLFSLLRSEEDCLQLFDIRMKFVSLTVICCSVFCVLQSTWYTTNFLSEAGCWNVICVYVPQKKQMCAQLELQKTCSWRCMCSCWRCVAFVATAVVVLSFTLFCFFSINSCIQLLLLYDGFLKISASLPASFEWVFVEAAVKQQLDVGRFSKLSLHVAAVC
jgi:hypothetical protein